MLCTLRIGPIIQCQSEWRQLTIVDSHNFDRCRPRYGFLGFLAAWIWDEDDDCVCLFGVDVGAAWDILGNQRNLSSGWSLSPSSSQSQPYIWIYTHIHTYIWIPWHRWALPPWWGCEPSVGGRSSSDKMGSPPYLTFGLSRAHRELRICQRDSYQAHASRRTFHVVMQLLSYGSHMMWTPWIPWVPWRGCSNMVAPDRILIKSGGARQSHSDFQQGKTDFRQSKSGFLTKQIRSNKALSTPPSGAGRTKRWKQCGSA